jgi:hypothetical protein
MLFFHWHKRILFSGNSFKVHGTPKRGMKPPSPNRSLLCRRQHKKQPNQSRREVAVAWLRIDSGSPKNWRRRYPSPPPAPPPSPISQTHGDDYLANLRFLQTLEIHREDQGFSEPVDQVEIISISQQQPRVSPEPDPDHERRSTYCKNSVTDGEVMIEIRGYSICQFFIHGIEYHFCLSKAGEDRFWHPPDEIKEDCRLWYLQCPRHIRKKFGLKDPPGIIRHLEITDNPHFNPHVLTY